MDRVSGPPSPLNPVLSQICPCQLQVQPISVEYAFVSAIGIITWRVCRF